MSGQWSSSKGEYFATYIYNLAHLCVCVSALRNVCVCVCVCVSVCGGAGGMPMCVTRPRRS